MHGRSLSRIAPLAALLALALALALAMSAAPALGDTSRPVTIGGPARFDVSPPLRSMRLIPPQANGHAFPARRRVGNTLEDIAPEPRDRGQQATAGTAASLVNGLGWDGVPNVAGVVPPDTNGDVGPNDYVQWVNLSFQIWSKDGTSLFGPAAGNTLWQGFGGPCELDNQGDPVVLYDRLADRWLFGQFGFGTHGGNPAAPYYECVAVSTSPDPTGSYYRYAFELNPVSNDFPDYPKLGVWPDGYYLSTNNFNGNTFDGAGAYVLDRTKMLAGDPTAGFVGFQLDPQYEGILPATVEGPTLPPSGSPDYFGSVDTSSSAGTGSTFQIWQLHADWTTPANSTFTGPANVPVNPYTFSFCGQTYSQACVPQPGTTQKLDPLSDRLLNRLEYRNFGDHESLVANHTVNVGSNRAGVRWYEIRSPGGSPFVAQQGTYAPSDGVSRWMGSVAMDGAGDIAIGYSASSSSVFPGVRFTAHAASDPAGVAGQAEQTMVAGSGSQTGSDRWGDYSAMAVDPSDDATFWYTQEYYSANSAIGWRTRIGSFQLGVPPPSVTMTSPAAGSATNDATPLFAGTAGTAAGDATTVSVAVHSGTSLTGSLVQTDSAVVMPDGSWSVSASPALPDGTYTAQASQTGAGGTGASASVTFTVDTVAPGAPSITSPANGTLTNSSTVTLSGTAEAGSTVTVLDGATSKGTATAGSGGAWTKTLTAVADGGHTYTAKATDAAGNTSPASSAVTVTVDTTAPAAPAITSPSNGTLTNSSTVTLSGTAEANSTVTVLDGGVSKGTASADSGGAWSKTLTSVADGSHTYTAKATDAAGNTSAASSSVVVTVDTTAPAPPSITSPASGTLTNSSTVTLSGTAEANSTVTVLDGATSKGTATANGSGAWSKTLSAVADGTHTYTAKATDAAGNTSAASSAVTVTVDTTAPVAPAITSPANGTLTNSSTVTLSGTAEANSTVTVFDGTTSKGTTTADGTGAWTKSLTAVADGSHTYTAKATDAAGNTSPASSGVSVTVDTTPPALAITTPAGGSSTNDSTPAIGGTSSDAGGVTITVYEGSGTLGPIAQTDSATASGGAWSTSASPALGEGTYTAVASESDAAGNLGTSAAVTFTVDTQAPAAPAISSPASGTLTNSSTVTLSGTAEANSTVTIFDGTTSKGTTIASGTGAWSKTLTSVADGTHTYTAKAADAAGNTSPPSNVVSVTVDTTPPAAPAITSPASGTLTDSSTVTLGGTAEAGSTVTVFDGATSKGTTSADGTGAWTKSLTSVADGSHTYTAKATDAAGNTSAASSSVTVTVDTTPPALAITAPANGSSTGDATPTLAGTSSDAGTVTITVHDGSGTAGPVAQTDSATASGGSWSTSASPALANGTYTAVATQTDAAGNLGTSAPAEFTVDTSIPPPTATFTFAPTAPFVGDVVTFSGSSPGSTITDWAWDFGDGHGGSAQTASHAYALPGSYTVQLTVTDDHDGTGATAQLLSVAALPSAPPATTTPSATPPPATPPATTPPAQPPTPTAAVRIPRQHLATVLRRGLRVLVRSNTRGRATIALTLGRHRAGRTAVTLDGAHWRAIRIRLTAATRRTLRHARRTRLTLQADVLDLAGGHVRLRQPLTLRR